MSTNDNSNRERAIFESALDIASAQGRRTYLQRACGDDAALLARVQALLQAHEAPEGFLPERPREEATVHQVTEKPGDRIGHYKLLEQIGEGGCGVVYMAEQVEPIRRRVALKVIKLGMDTKQVVARFEAERQALALMDHPNIAKVLDAGTTDTGRPFFVMELVRGIKITDYCDENRLSTQERLNLFVQVCHAIQHAHQKGIIHRDIKPSNILVTLNDGVPVPKVIDFGIAKAIGQQLTDKTVFTAFEQFIGTPAYMSPEQAVMTSLDVDTRSDIYALGVLLYELLTGHTPFDQKELVAAGLDEMRRIIREQEPVRPSTCLSTLADPERTTVARRHHADPPQLIHLLRGDLDWIVMKSLDKDRTRRYETANGLANDVLRHLNNETVAARPPSQLYRFQKLVRRNKLVFAAGSAVVAALVIGLGLSTCLFFKERAAHERAVAAEKKAQTEANKSQQVAQFLQDMLKGVGPSVAMGRDTTMLREILDKTAERVGKDLKDSPEVEAELRTTLGQMYQALGQFTRAEEMHRAALVIRRGLWGNMNTKVADSLGNLVKALEWQTRPAEAEPLALEALTIRTNLLGAEHPKVAESLAALGVVRSDQGRYTEAEELHRHALAMRRKLLGNESLTVADSLVELGGLLISQGRYEEAEAPAREAVAIQKRLLGEECPDPNLGASQILLGRVLRDEGKDGEAETILRSILAMRRKLVGSESLLVAYPSIWLAAVLAAEGKLDEAEQLGREALATYRKLKASSTPEGAIESAWCINGLASVLHQKGKLPEAEALFRELYEWVSTWPKTESHFVNLYYGWGGNGLVTVLREEGKLGQAEAFCRDAVASQRKLLASSDDPSRSQQLAPLLVSFAGVLQTQGKLAEAEAVLREAIESAKKSPASHSQAIMLGGLGDWFRDRGRPAEAEPLYREGLTLCRQSLTNDFSARQFLAGDLCTLLRNEGRLAEAEALGRETLEVGRKLPPSSHLARVLAVFADVLRDEGKLAEAEPLYREGLNISRTISTGDLESHRWLAGSLAGVLKNQGKLAEAETLWREIVEVGRKLNNPNELAVALGGLGDLMREQSKAAQAEPLYREGLDLCRKALPNDFEKRQWLASGLGVALKDQGKLAEAEAVYREAVTNAAKVWPNDFAKWEWQFNDLIDVLQRQGKLAEANQLTGELLTPIAETSPGSARSVAAQAELCGQQGKWKEAISLYTRALELEPTNHLSYHKLAPLLVFTADYEGYRRHCRQILERFSGTGDPFISERMAKDCLLLSSSGADPRIVSNWVQNAITVPTNHGALPWFRQSKGLEEYRQGRFADAVQWELQVTSIADTAPTLDAEAYSVLAMAQHELKHDAEARAALAKALELAQTKLPHLGSDNPGPDWQDWLIAHILLREAQALVAPLSGMGSAAATNAQAHAPFIESRDPKTVTQ